MTSSSFDPESIRILWSSIILHEPGAVEVDLVPAHGHALAAEPLELGLAHRGGAVCAHHAVPGDIAVDRGEDAPDQARRRRLDVGVGAYESLRDRPHARQDAVGVA